MISSEMPMVKPRRKYEEVPVHKPERDKQTQPVKLKKTYSANFSPKTCCHPDHASSKKISEVIIEIPEKDPSSRPSKRNLSREIERLTQDNEQIAGKFAELEDLSVKKILKLKEKVGNLQNINSDLLKENESLRHHYQELQKAYEEAYNQLELSKVCKRCQQLEAQLEAAIQENQALSKRNVDVSQDLEMLKTVVFRLNAQLERYQEKLRKHNISIEKYSQLHPQKSSTNQYRETEIINILSEDHQNHRHTPVSWGPVNSHTLGPLLDAYQDTINEKDEIIQNYELNLASFTGKMKEVIEENENLYKKLTEDERCGSKLGKRLEQVSAELKATKDQNDALIKKCAIKQDKIEEILKVYETKVDQMKRDYQLVHDEYIKLRTENASLKEKITSLANVQEDFQNERQKYIPIAVHTASVNECKKWYEELKHQYEVERSKLQENIESQARWMDEMKKVKEAAEDRVVKLEKELKKSESKQLDLEHVLNEVQLSRSACRKQLHKAMGFAKDMVAEQETLLRALNQRQLENRAVKNIGSEMACRMDSLKSQLKLQDVQKSAWEEFTTVEQRIQKQAELIETMKDEHRTEIDNLQQIIDEQQQKLAKQNKHLPTSHFQLFKEKYK
ncbi:protein Cep89 homolog isoform X1 [Dendroctonus ponderosae]|uniref:protein Cep89 homolog isoform X1 n=1 Tax=Dendroctonus ponderosae TaxID=77166 RepID=UPI0020352A31|nr:protein Cep89 homolog isoform X1 [Dendroctonus ponderosae]